jgi:nicotinic acid mononucleotide adenylyltransferase
LPGNGLCLIETIPQLTEKEKKEKQEQSLKERQAMVEKMAEERRKETEKLQFYRMKELYTVMLTDHVKSLQVKTEDAHHW